MPNQYPTKNPDQQHDTPWARLLLNYMWKRPDGEPPLTTGQLGAKIGMTRASINNWVYRGQTPPIDRMLQVLNTLGIPAETLRAYYLDFGHDDPLPPSLFPGLAPMPARAHTTTEPPDTAPAPRQLSPAASASERRPSDDPWLAMMAEVSASMRAVGMNESAIRAVLDHIQHKRSGADPMQRHLIAEHTPTHAPAHTTEPQTTPERDRDPHAASQPHHKGEGADTPARDTDPPYTQRGSRQTLTDKRASYRARRQPKGD